MTLDAIVVGGGFAGIAAATYLARGRRRVAIIDSGRPRNRFAAASHGLIGQDGSNPREILDRARSQVLSYAGVEWHEDEAIAAAIEPEGFSVTLRNEATLRGRKLILAFGLHDSLPDLPGIEGRWGHSVLHCPYCHGIEYSDRALGVLYCTPMSVHQASLIAEWGPTTLFLNGNRLDEAEAAMLAARGVRVEECPVLELVGTVPELSAIVLKDGRNILLAALYVAPNSSLSSPLAHLLGVEIEERPLGPLIRTDGDKMTSIPGIYAAGDIARMPHSVTWAAADGVTAGVSAHRALVFG